MVNCGAFYFGKSIIEEPHLFNVIVYRCLNVFVLLYHFCFGNGTSVACESHHEDSIVVPAECPGIVETIVAFSGGSYGCSEIRVIHTQ